VTLVSWRCCRRGRSGGRTLRRREGRRGWIWTPRLMHVWRPPLTASPPSSWPLPGRGWERGQLLLGGGQDMEQGTDLQVPGWQLGWALAQRRCWLQEKAPAAAAAAAEGQQVLQSARQRPQVSSCLETHGCPASQTRALSAPHCAAVCTAAPALPAVRPASAAPPLG
jgi:hypothetical protein